MVQFSKSHFPKQSIIVTARTIGGVANLPSLNKVEEPWMFEREVPACGTECNRRADMSLDTFKISQLVRARSACLLEQNFLRAGCSTQIAGSCKVYAKKTASKTI